MTTETNTKRPITSLSGPSLPFWRRIQWNLIFYFVVLAVVPVSVIVSLVVSQLQQQAKDQVTNQLESVATLKTQLIDQWLTGSQTVLFTMAASDAEDKRFSVLSTPNAFDFERNQEIVNGILTEGVKSANTFTEIFYYDLTGAVRASSNSVSIGKSTTRQPYFAPSLAEQYIQSPYIDAGTGELTALVTYPVHNINGQIIGVLAGRLNLDILSQIMQQRTGLATSSETYLVSAQNNYLLTPSRFEGYQANHTYHSEGIDNALLGKEGSGTYDNYRDPSVRVIGVYRWVPQLQAALLAEQDQAEALKSFNNARLNGLLLAAGGALIAILIGLYAATRFSRPILSLTNTATRIAIGDLSERAVVRQRNELGVLAAAFNEMASQLQQMVSSLEERIAARTRDLFLTLEVGQMATRVSQQSDLLPRVTDFIRERFDLYYTQVYLIDDVGRYAVLAAGTGEVGEQLLDRKHRLDLTETSIVARTVQTQRPVLVEDTENSTFHRPNPLLPETRSEVAIPLIIGDEVIGVLDMQARAAETFREDNLPVFEAMASQLASAVRSAQSYTETQAAVERADAINRRLTGEAWSSYLGRLGEGETVGYEYDLQHIIPLTPTSPIELPSGDGQDGQLALPVALRGQPIGTIQVEDTANREREWTEDEVELVKDVADRVALALEQFRAFDETRVALSETEEQAQRLADLNEMAAQLSTAADLNEVYRVVAIWTNRVLHGDRASLALLNPDGESFEIFGLDGVQGAIPMGAALPRKGTWIGKVVDEQRTLRLDDMRGEPYPETRQLAGQGLCSSLNVPLVVGTETIGTLNVASQRPNAFGPRDEGLIRQIASLFTSHLQTQELLTQTRKRAAEMEAVAEVGAQASATLDPDELLWNISNLVKERFNLYHAHIYLLNTANNTLELAAGAGEAGRLMVGRGHKIALEHRLSLVARAVRTRQGVIANDVTQAPDFLPNPMLPETRSELAIPMIVGDQVIGVLDVQSQTIGRFTDDDLQIQSTLASQIAVAVQNARSFAESQQRLAIIETANSAIFLGTLDGQVLYLNPFGAQMLGYSAEEIPSLAIPMMQPPETMPRVANEILPTVFKQGMWHGENTLITKDGRHIPVEQTAFLIRDENGEPQFLAAIMNDITERLASASELDQQRRMLQALLENLPVGVFMAEAPSGRSLIANTAALEMLGRGLSPEAGAEQLAEVYAAYLEGTTTLYPAEQMPLVRGMFGEHAHVDNMEIIKPSGEHILLDVQGAPIHDATGTVRASVAVFQDITERRAAEEELRKLSQAVEQSPTSVIITNLAGEIEYVNAAFVEVSGYTAEEAIGQNPRILRSGETSDEVYREMWRTISAGGTWNGELLNKRKDGSLFWEQTAITPIANARGEITHYLAVKQDITERRQINELIRKRAVEMEAVAQVGAEAAATLDVQQMLWNVSNLTKERFGLYHAHIYLLDASGQNLVLAAGAGSAGPTMVRAKHHIPMSHERSLVARAAQSHVGVIVNDVTRTAGFLPNPMLPDTRSEMAIPLIVGDQVLGVLDVQAEQVDYFTGEDLQVFSTLAAQIAVSVQNARQFEQTQLRVRDLQVINQISEYLRGGEDLDSTLERVIEAVLEAFGGDNILISVLDHETQMWHGQVGVGGELTTAIAKSLSDPAAAYPHGLECIRTGLAVAVDDIHVYPDFPAQYAEALKSALALPIFGDETSTGVLFVNYLQSYHSFLPEELTLAQGISDQIAVGYDAKRAEQDLAEREQLLRTIIDTTPDWIFAKDTDYRYLLANKTFAESYGGLTTEEMIGKNDYELGISVELIEGNPDLGITGIRADDHAVIVDQQTIHNPNNVVDFMDGSRHVFDTTKSPLRDVEGNVFGVLGFSHDITERLQAEQEREHLLEDLQRVSIRLQDRLKEISALQEISAYSGEDIELDEYLERVAKRIPPSMQHPDVCAAAIEFEGRLFGDNVALETLWKLVVPLQISGEQVGTINVGYVEEREFLAEETPHLEAIGERIETFIQGRRLFAQIQKRATEMQTVSEVGAEASATLDPNEMLQNVVNLAKERFGLYHAHIYLLDETGDNLILAAGAGNIGDMMVKAGHRISTGHERSLVARAARGRHGVIVNDVAAAPDFLPNPMLPATRAELAMPMIIGDQVIGVLDVQSDEIGHFSDEDLQVQATLASQVAVAVNNARLFEQTQRRATEMQAVAEVGAEASATLDQQSLLWNVANLVKDRFSLYHAHIYLLDNTGQNLVLAAGAGEAGKLMVAGGHRIPLRHEQSLVVRAARSGQTVIVNDVTRAPDFLPNPMLPKTRSELASPMIVGGRVIGVLDVQADRVNRFTAEDMRVISTLSSQIAVAVNNAQLFAEQLEVADRLREVDRLKSEFLASMSHELRTPLNSIIGYAEVLLDGIDGDLTEDMNEDVGAIHGSGKHLLNLINDILDLAKIEAGQMDLVMENFELYPLVEDTASIQRVLLKDKAVDLVMDIPDDLPQIHADPLRVRQVVSNLITNAIKFTEQGSITVQARRYEQDPTLIRVSVIDTGMGMRPDQLQVIFDRFRQVDQSHTRRAGGTGLGLSITRQLIQMHGGDIWVESEPGAGSVFHFTLPAATETAEG